MSRFIIQINMFLEKLHLKIALILCGIFAMFEFCECANPDNVYLAPVTSYPCEDFDQKITLNVDIHNVSDEKRVADIDIILNDEFNGFFQACLTVDKLVNDEWTALWSPVNGNVCDMMKQYLPGALKKIKEQITPSISGECSADPDTYKITDFEISSDDYSIPVDSAGRYKSKVIISDEMDNQLCCHEFITDIIEKS